LAVAPNTGMEKGEMKRFLAMAAKEPVNCAVGVAAEPGIGLLVLHKTKSPKALEKDLSGKFPSAKAIRWGTVAVSEDDGVVKFTINKAVSGLAPRLVKTLKGTGHSKVEILLEDGTSVDGAAEEKEGEEGEAHEAEAQAPEAPVQAGPDAAELGKKLAGLIKQIGAVTDGRRASELKAVAVEANTALKGGDAAAAKTAVDKLASLLGAGGASQTAPAGTVGIVAMQKSRLLWDSARKKVGGEIAELKKRVLAEFEGDPEEAQVMDALDQLDEITSTLDERLIDALDDLLSEQDPAKHAELLEDAKEVLADYAKFVQSNELVQKLNGETPFGMSLSIGSTMAATVKALQASLR